MLHEVSDNFLPISASCANEYPHSTQCTNASGHATRTQFAGRDSPTSARGAMGAANLKGAVQHRNGASAAPRPPRESRGVPASHPHVHHSDAALQVAPRRAPPGGLLVCRSRVSAWQPPAPANRARSPPQGRWVGKLPASASSSA